MDKLTRKVLVVSRLLDFCTAGELQKQTGCGSDAWGTYIIKELVDNAIDACEDAGIAPVVSVGVTEDRIVVTDNGPGIPEEVVRGVLDFTVHVSSRVGYVSPTRGAQGNALKHVVAIPYVLDSSKSDRVGRVEIEARGLRHRIALEVNHVKGCPEVEYPAPEPCDHVAGTKITVHWPSQTASSLDDEKSAFLLLAKGFALCNPHLSLRLEVKTDDERMHEFWPASDPAWTKWMPSDPTSAHWYRLEDLEKLIGARVNHGSAPSVRDFVMEFKGLTGSRKATDVCEAAGLSRATLDVLTGKRDYNHAKVQKLLDAMKAESRPVQPKTLGVIGEAHVRACFEAEGCNMGAFHYQASFSTSEDGLPQVTEFAFAPYRDDVDADAEEEPLFDYEDWDKSQEFYRRIYQCRRRRCVLTGHNWAPAVNGVDLFPDLEEILDERSSSRRRPVVVFAHIVCPRTQYRDQGKSVVIFEE
jgi:hypothetical protein